MAKINQLSFAVANLIAAGEVVDRPASVIKELLENAIDAGASRVTVEIQHGGVTFMRVADNGCGMDREDLAVSIRRHATSKIKDAADLDGILTLGFRGEALAAIAAVSDLRILTKTKEAPYGAMLESHGGEIVGIHEQGCPEGTTVIVENLFGNVPARKKFLKKDVAESVAVSTYVEKIALSRPDIAVRLIIDGNVKLDTAGDGSLKSAMYAVFGRDFVGRMIEVEGGNDTVRVHGFIGRSDNVRPKRNYENFFINGRFINCRTASAAVEQAYTSFIPPERFPCCVLNIEINPSAVDVNVHPAKLEVKFSNERPVFDAVYYTVRAALEENEQRPEIKLGTTAPKATQAFMPVEDGRRESLAARQITINTAKQQAEIPHFSRMDAGEYRQKIGTFAAATPAFRAQGENKQEGVFVPAHEKECKVAPTELTPPVARPALHEQGYQAPVPVRESQAEPVLQEKKPQESVQEPLLPDYRIVGEAFCAFVILERGEELLLIDKHAAHERVLFEQLKSRMREKAHSSQMLLLPISLPLSVGDRDLLTAYRDEIESIGFAFAAEGGALALSEIPEGLSPAQATELLLSLLSSLQEGTGNAALARDIVFEKALYQGACKAAIKAGREYSAEDIKWLCERLMALPDITVCPHGRPVAMVLSHAELNRQFGRG